MTINPRTKGKSGELEFAGLIHDWSGVRLVRNLEQPRNGGHDLIVHPDETGHAADAFRQLAIEIKRHSDAKPGHIIRWWQQAVDQAQRSRKEPVLAYRANRRDWRVVLPLCLVNPGMSRSTNFNSTAELSVQAFCAVVIVS